MQVRWKSDQKNAENQLQHHTRSRNGRLHNFCSAPLVTTYLGDVAMALLDECGSSERSNLRSTYLYSYDPS